MENKKYPKSWTVVPLGNFVESEKGKKPKKQKSTPDEEFIYPYVDIEAFEKGNIRSWTDGDGCRLCNEDDFLMVWDGSRSGLVGKGVNGALGSTLVRINFPKINNHYAFYFLQSKYLEINTRAKGVGIPHVNPNLLWNYDFPIAPLNEQKRIVAKIEELFSELDKGIESLKTAQAQLKTYRQAILKHAFEGKLTKNWRDENKNNLETADELLKKIKTEREEHDEQQIENWQEGVEQWEEADKEGKKPIKPKKLAKISFINENKWIDLPSLPSDWKWVELQALSLVITDGDHQAPPQSKDGIPFIVISNIKNNRVDFRNTKYVPEEYYNSISTNRKPVNGDILYTVTGSFGIPSVIDFDKKFCFQRHVALIRPLRSICSKFLYYTLQNPLVFQQAKAVATGTAQKTVPLSGLREFSIPFFSILEQNKIVLEIDTKFLIIDQLEKYISDNLQKAEALRQSILKKAFSGKLVAQDPNDEPASVLLERIKAEKEATSKQKGKKCA